MVESLVYLSDEWIKIAKEKLENELTPEKMNNLTTSLVCFYKNCPENCDKFLYVGYKDGNLDKFYVGVGEPDDAEFKIIGDYNIFAKIS